MKDERIETSAQAIAKAKEMQQKMVDLFNRVKDENTSIQDIVRADLQAANRWDDEHVESIIANLQKGIATYQAMRNENKESYTLTLEQLEEMLKDVPAEQQKDKLIATLSVLAFIEDTGSDITKLHNDCDVMSLEALKDLVVSRVNKDETYSDVIERLKEDIESFELSELQLPEQYGELSEDYKLYVAVQSFLEADDIKEDNLEAQAQAIGSTSAAAVDIAYETARWQNGEISEKTWHTVVKSILAILAICVITVILLLTAVDLLLNVLLLFTAIFGFGALSVFTAMILGYAFAAAFIYLLYKGFEAADSGVLEDIDAFLEKCFCKIDEWIANAKKAVPEFLKKIRERIAKQPVVPEGQTIPAEPQVAQPEAEVQVQPVPASTLIHSAN